MNMENNYANEEGLVSANVTEEPINYEKAGGAGFTKIALGTVTLACALVSTAIVYFKRKSKKKKDIVDGEAKIVEESSEESESVEQEETSKETEE